MALPFSLRTVVSMPFEENTYILWRDGSPDALVIDPGFDPDAILQEIKNEGLNVAAILNTHGHADHIAGNDALKQAFPSAPLIIGVNEARLLQDPWANLSAPFGAEIISPPADRTVAEGDTVETAGFQFAVREIPGHSPGHVVFILRGEPTVVFGGDVLFRGSVGRTDFPGGSMNQLASGIREKLYVLPEDTLVYPGHGPVTTTGHEKRTNPYIPGA